MMIARVRMLAWIASAVCCMVLHAADISIDCAKKQQVVHGFGTCFSNWQSEINAVISKPEFQKMYVTDLGATVVRLDLEGRVLKGEVASPAEISYKNFDWGRVKTEVEGAAAVYKLNPREVKIIASVWSPPHWMKQGAEIRYGDESCKGHLRADRREHFAHWLAQWCIGLKEKYGFPLYAVSIQNELLFEEPYKSCVYTAQEYFDTMMVVGEVFKKLNIETKIMGPEDMTFWPDRYMKFVDPLMADPKGKEYLNFFCSHGYTDGVQGEGSKEKNDALWNALKKYNRELWMTETGGEGAEWNKGGSGGAIGLAGKLHNGLVYGHVSGWAHWQIAEKPGGIEHALMILDKPTKKYYVFKQFSRFIRPGSVRVEAGPDGKDGLSVSAYTHEKRNGLVIVFINRGKAEAPVSLKIENGPKLSQLVAYRSSAAEDFAPLPAVAVADGKAAITLPAETIVTLATSLPEINVDASAVPAQKAAEKPAIGAKK